MALAHDANADIAIGDLDFEEAVIDDDVIDDAVIDGVQLELGGAGLPHEAIAGTWGAAAREWIAAAGVDCAACGYPLAGVPEPRCPECGRTLRLADLRHALSALPVDGAPTTARLWSGLRTLGTGAAWCAEAVVFVSLVLIMLTAGSLVPLTLIGAMLGLLALPGVGYTQLVVRSIIQEHRRVLRRAPLREPHATDRMFWQMRGLIGLFVVACLVFAAAQLLF